MALPKFRSIRLRHRDSQYREKTNTGFGQAVDDAHDSERTLSTTYHPGVDLRRATRTRRNSILASCFFFLAATVFLILVIIGQVRNQPGLNDIYFFQINLANIIPVSVPNSVLINSITRSLGLHDFYNVGLWNYCEGYFSEGVTACAAPQDLYWFNPVEILTSELLAGATISLPNEVVEILRLLQVVSNLMFGFFITGCVMNFVSIFLAPLALYSRWWSFPLAIFTFISALLTTVACVIATVMFIIFRIALQSQSDLNISASLGVKMFAFMWTAAACTITAFMIHLCISCCCASRRDVKRGRKRGSLKAYGDVADKGRTGFGRYFGKKRRIMEVQHDL